MNDFIPKIKIIGIGGGGSNIISKMISKINSVDLLIIDTNKNSLEKHDIKNKMQIGKTGLGAGSKPEVGKKAFRESFEEIKNHLQSSDLVFLVAGFGGGTGTGVLPEIAKPSKEMGILTISVITKPFEFEGVIRKKIAEQGLKELGNNTDSYLVIDNNKLSKIAKNNLTFLESFRLVDEFVYKVINEIVQLLTIPSFINLDFADLKTIMETSGKAVIGIGIGKGQDKIENVINTALSSVLLEDYDISDANKLMLNIVASQDVSYNDIKILVDKLKEKLKYRENTQVIFGARIDENLENEIKLTLIATDFEYKSKLKHTDNDLPEEIRQISHEETFSIYDYLEIPAYKRRGLNKLKDK